MSTPGTALITGTTSGVGLNATCALVKRGWTVITANRSPQRAAAAADEMDLPKERLQHVLMDLGDLDSVRRVLLMPCPIVWMPWFAMPRCTSQS